MHPRCQLLSGHLASARVALRCPSSRRTLATTASTTTAAPPPPAPAPSTPSPSTPAPSPPSPAVKNPLQRRKGGDLGSHLPKYVIAANTHMPDYPYGDHALFKQANRGLYGEQMIQFGNNVSHKTKTKTRRNWKPNVLSKSLYSVALKKRVKLRVTASVLKTMDREGGLDEYLLKDSAHRIKELGPMGWALRWTLMQKPTVIARLRADAAALGLDQATIDKQWPTPQMVSQEQGAAAFLARQAQIVAQDPAAADVEQEMWAPDSTPASTSTRPQPKLSGRDLTIANTITRQERTLAAKATVEYSKAVTAAERYLERGLVDSVEEGLKLAFVRAPERHAARLALKNSFTTKLATQFTAADLAALRERLSLPTTLKDDDVRRIAYNQWRRAEVEKAGSYEAWRAAASASTAATRKAALDQAGSPDALLASRRAAHAAALTRAETASANGSLNPTEREALEIALVKADRAIRARAAGGRGEYVRLAIEAKRALRPADELAALARKAGLGAETEGDAWGKIVGESRREVRA